MEVLTNSSLVQTIKERCRMCYTCVRDCPAKAIRVVEGQSEVVAQRCIGCGNCVRVCSQEAKVILDTTGAAEALFRTGEPVAAILAPSFPAAFPALAYRTLLGMLKALGFAYVHEVAFGADLVAAAYRRLLQENPGRNYIATTCPAIVGYVERYHPDLVGNLAPIVSPMAASAMVARAVHGKGVRTVFIGPCIAKKAEAPGMSRETAVDAVLTFVELEKLFVKHGLSAESVVAADFDPPFAAMGGVFPLKRGMLQAAGLAEDLVNTEVVAAAGRLAFVDSIREFGEGSMDARLLEVLCCEGCIMGPGVQTNESQFVRRSHMSRYLAERLAAVDKERWKADMARHACLDFGRGYESVDMRLPPPSDDEIRIILARMGKKTQADELNCGACGYETCREHAVAVFKGLAESEMCLPNTIEKLRFTIQELGVSNHELARTQEALLQSEKLASMGQLAAGIAHELNNPLGVVLMYTHLLLDEIGGQENASGAKDDLAMIAEQADRCKRIVSGLLHFARQNRVVREPVSLREVLDKSLLALAIPPGIETQVSVPDPSFQPELDRDQMIQVLTNLCSNAIAAMEQGGLLRLEGYREADYAIIRVTDTGTGISPESQKKIFEPFFTTKAIGKGTGLGLAVVYGIVKMHSGDITMVSNHDASRGPTGTSFSVRIPVQADEK